MKAEILPEIPPEIQNRGPIPLSQHAVQDGKTVTIDQPLKNSSILEALAKNKAKKALPMTPEAKKILANPNPLKGMTAAQIEEVRSRQYDDAPKMDGNLGDLTPSFMEWLKANHPQDWAIRYAYRLNNAV